MHIPVFTYTFDIFTIEIFIIPHKNVLTHTNRVCFHDNFDEKDFALYIYFIII